MSDSEKLDNLWNFINVTIISPGHGFEYRNALQYLIQGYSYEDVVKWYNKEMGIDDGNKDS